MKCYDDQILQAYLDRESDEEQGKSIEKHIKTCGQCKHKLEELQAFHEWMEDSMEKSTPQIEFEKEEIDVAWNRFEEKLVDSSATSKQENLVHIEQDGSNKKRKPITFYKKWVMAASFIVIVTSMLAIPQINSAAKGFFSYIQENLLDYTLEYDTESKVIRDVAGNLVVYFEEDQIYDAYDNPITVEEYKQIIASYGGIDIPYNENDFTLYDDALIRGINIKGKSEEEIRKAVEKDKMISLIKFEAESIGMDIEGEAESELRDDFSEKLEGAVSEAIQNGIKNLKEAYQLDPGIYQNIGLDLTNKTDEQIKIEMYELLMNGSIDIPYFNQDDLEDQMKVTTPAQNVAAMFFGYDVLHADHMLTEAKELGLDINGLIISEISDLVYQTKE
ncbi:anti-sigma factor family protein [Chengkuizengella axinellae]|uniref:Zf-HC2 domain-containing protein n=1 Tax=Chengkuizengella axinellae TaxID=3064388 RepID=A0ABT9J2W9_9BACL|nr:zf-HC2 domain-containing protein [Chengkuizengella sp. 2205SS18-9]MDP5275966.1 zf-HC2 domain-containing protein [Chengkuizengella sp. 2205SS18-9]